jgi:membrane protein YqaA with SNARE-associated domain
MTGGEVAGKGGPFRRLYQWMLVTARHPHANAFLGVISFAESSFFPIPPDVMLAPMVLARPRHWFVLATITTLASVAGGAAGYAIGHYLIDWAMPVIERFGYRPAYDTAVEFFARYGFYAIIIKGLTPIPYKIFTISAGAAQMPFWPFMAASLIGRGMRFYLVAGVVQFAGPAVQERVLRHIEILGWTFVCLLIGGFIALKYL